VQWLAQEFGEGRATAAFLVNREHSAASWLERSRPERSPERSLMPERGGDFGGHNRPSSHDRGGYDFGR